MVGHGGGRFLSKLTVVNGKKKLTSVCLNRHLYGCSRAGVSVSSPFFKELLTTLFTSPAISVHGFYGHAGNSYASKSLAEASSYLSSEVDAVNSAAATALAMFPDVELPFVLSVGSTPTAHAASYDTRQWPSKALHGTLELHAGQ